MDIEQLRLILETVGAAGEGAIHLAYIWFALEALDTICSYGFLGVGVYFCYRWAKAGAKFVDENL